MSIILNHHGIASLGMTDCLFLTYFDSFDNDTKVDNPLVGPECRYSDDGQSYELSSLNLFGVTQNSILNNYSSSSKYNFIFQEDIPSGVKYISSELFVLTSGTRGDLSSGIYLNPSLMALDSLWSNTEFGSAGPLTADGRVTEFFNDATYSTWNYLKPGINIRYKLSHLAMVWDLENNVETYYVDGIIQARIQLIEQDRKDFYAIRFGQNGVGKSFNITGIAIWAKNMSINGGMSYPVPTKRYA